MADTNQLAISANHLVRKFGEFTAVNDVSFRVRKGEIFGFLGPNGSGKTTVIKMLTGLVPMTSGDATVQGIDVASDPEGVRENIGYMSQNFSLYSDLTVSENLTFYGRIYGLPADRLRQRMDEVIQLNGLGPYLNRLSAQLSGGWKQRLALGCAMLHQPTLIFLDEPTAGIDPVARRQLWDLLFELSAHGITFFVTTHYMDEAERCSHVAYIYFGKVIADGTPDALRGIAGREPRKNVSRGNYGAASDAGPPRDSSDPWHSQRDDFGQSVHALIDDDLDLNGLRMQLQRQGVTVAEIRPLAPSLEDVFVELTYKHQAISAEEAKRG